MTEDYKKSLIDYVSGMLKIEDQQPTDFDPEYSGANWYDYNGIKWEDVIVALRGYNTSINGILEDESTDIFIMYGAYQESTGGNSKGFLIYFSRETDAHTPINIKLLNGRGFQYLKFDNVSNRVYGVVGDRGVNATATDNDAYFVYYNNLFLTYENGVDPELTYSYKIWEDSSTNYYMVRDIVKHPDNSYYLIFATAFSTTNKPVVQELKINVGESNELKTWSIGTDYLAYAFYGWYDGDTPHFKTIIKDTNESVFNLAYDNGDNVGISSLSIDTTIENEQINYIKPNYVSTSDANIYFVFNESYTEDNTTKKRCNLIYYDGTSLKLIYKTSALSFNQTDGYNIPMINVVRDSTTIYMIRYIPDELNDITYVKICDISQHSNPQESDFETIDNVGYIYRFNMYNQRAILRRQFNMIYFDMFSGYLRTGLGNYDGDVNGYQETYCSINPRFSYVGYPYSDYNVLVPKYANIGILSVVFFSRNFYNVSIFENTTTSSVEIPSNYCNQPYIQNQRMIGTTAYELVRNTQSLNKNKYEVVHLNFINTINVIDEDTGNTYKYSAIRTNYATTRGGQTNYDNTKCTKYRINYNDNSTLIGDITWININDLNKKTKFTIYADKQIDSIDLITNDGNAVFLHIVDNFEVGKYYTIRQKVRIGNRPQVENLQYNGEDVLYNNEQVQVYV